MKLGVTKSTTLIVAEIYRRHICHFSKTLALMCPFIFYIAPMAWLLSTCLMLFGKIKNKNVLNTPSTRETPLAENYMS